MQLFILGHRDPVFADQNAGALYRFSALRLGVIPKLLASACLTLAVSTLLAAAPSRPIERIERLQLTACRAYLHCPVACNVGGISPFATDFWYGIHSQNE